MDKNKVESVFRKVVLVRDERGRKILGKGVDFDARGRAIIHFRKGPLDTKLSTMTVNPRKAKILEDGIPPAILRGRKSKGA